MSLAAKSIHEIIGAAKIEGYKAIVDLREIHCKTRRNITPYFVMSLAHKCDLIMLDQLVFGEDLSPEVKLRLESNGEWWIKTFYEISKTMNIVFLTAASDKKIRNGKCLVSEIVEQIKLLKIREEA